MADVNNSVSHSDLSFLPIISGETVDKFIKLHCIANETNVRGYSFFREQYVHDFEGNFDRLVSVRCWHCNVYCQCM
jgi:hypothetical protein